MCGDGVIKLLKQQEIWQVKTSTRGDSWGDHGVVGECGAMGCLNYKSSKRSGKRSGK